jgi:hypothetical protein
VELPFVISPRWSQLVSDLHKECKRRGCRLMVLFTPFHPALIEARDMSAADRWFKQIASDNPAVITCGKAIWSLRADCMWNWAPRDRSTDLVKAQRGMSPNRLRSKQRARLTRAARTCAARAASAR